MSSLKGIPMSESAVADIYDNIVLSAKQHVGGNEGFTVLGPNLRRAVVALEILQWQHRMAPMLDGGATALGPTVLALYGELNDQFPWED